MRFCVPAMIAALLLAATATAQTPQPAPRGPIIYRGLGMQGGETPLPPEIEAKQKELIGAALAGLQAQRPGTRDVYVMTAGLWSDHVFESEATGAAEILTERYGAQGRTLVLSTNYAPTGKGLPAATPEHLIGAFDRIGALMDKDEDLFVLFMTSHGGPNAGIGLRDRERMDYTMSPANLRGALDKAGIKKRVVILAACYSGQFVQAFRDDPNTIMLTAASKDRPSFGCQPERDWTYFGDAFFNRALRAGGGLAPAFQRARKQIAQWEAADGELASDPQIYVGAEAARLLALVEQDIPPAKPIDMAATRPPAATP
jgi:Peptidase C13 family